MKERTCELPLDDGALGCLATVQCEFCEVCVLICPDLCITRDPVTSRIVIDLTLCKGCGLCAAACPKKAIAMVLDR